jgi:hypothetical protein
MNHQKASYIQQYQSTIQRRFMWMMFMLKQNRVNFTTFIFKQFNYVGVLI